jgi:hypothetical protein
MRKVPSHQETEVSHFLLYKVPYFELYANPQNAMKEVESGRLGIRTPDLLRVKQPL